MKLDNSNEVVVGENPFYTIKHCLGCPAKDLSPIMSKDEKTVTYKCPDCDSRYRVNLISMSPVLIMAIIRQGSSFYYVADVDARIFFQKILIDADNLQLLIDE